MKPLFVHLFFEAIHCIASSTPHVFCLLLHVCPHGSSFDEAYARGVSSAQDRLKVVPARRACVRSTCARPNPHTQVPRADMKLSTAISDSCDCLLHGRCVDVPTPQDLPHVYICAFCANTPNMRGGRMRHTGRTNAGDGVRGGRGLATGAPVPSSAASAAAAAIASSPLAHKSFRSFR